MSFASKERKGPGNKRRLPPKPGDQDYKTPTQLRNARKRRKVKNEKQQQQSQPKRSGHGPTRSQDPSLQFLATPLAAPTVKKAIVFFQQHPAKSASRFDVFVGPTTGWRTVAKLAVRMSSGCLQMGLFAPGTHELLAIPQYQAHHPRINAAVEVIRKQCRKLEIPPYSETTGQGNLRHVILHVERATGRQQITLVWNDMDQNEKKSPSLLQSLCDVLIQSSNKEGRGSLDLHSLWIHYNNNCKYDNNIFDRNGRWEQKFGQSNAIVENLDVAASHLKVPLHFPPQVFRQANIDAFSAIIVNIRSWLKKRIATVPVQRCLELYGGVGTIGLHLVDLVSDSLLSSDENPYNKSCFEKSLAQIKVAGAVKKCKTIRYESKNASAMMHNDYELQNADLIVVDPPRKGLDPEVVHALCNREYSKKLRSLVYVSCGFDAFCRDFETLTGTGGWHLDHAEGHVLFPGSDAIETLAFFTRDS